MASMRQLTLHFAVGLALLVVSVPSANAVAPGSCCCDFVVEDESDPEGHSASVSNSCDPTSGDYDFRLYHGNGCGATEELYSMTASSESCDSLVKYPTTRESCEAWTLDPDDYGCASGACTCTWHSTASTTWYYWVTPVALVLLIVLGGYAHRRCRMLRASRLESRVAAEQDAMSKAVAQAVTRSQIYAAHRAGLIARHGAPPPNLCCPISHELMAEPARTPCNHVFERAAILTWLASREPSMQTCPSCRALVRPEKLVEAQDVMDERDLWAYGSCHNRNRNPLAGNDRSPTPDITDSSSSSSSSPTARVHAGVSDSSFPGRTRQQDRGEARRTTETGCGPTKEHLDTQDDAQGRIDVQTPPAAGAAPPAPPPQGQQDQDQSHEAAGPALEPQEERREQEEEEEEGSNKGVPVDPPVPPPPATAHAAQDASVAEVQIVVQE